MLILQCTKTYYGICIGINSQNMIYSILQNSWDNTIKNVYSDEHYYSYQGFKCIIILIEILL